MVSNELSPFFSKYLNYLFSFLTNVPSTPYAGVPPLALVTTSCITSALVLSLSPIFNLALISSHLIAQLVLNTIKLFVPQLSQPPLLCYQPSQPGMTDFTKKLPYQ